MRLRRVLLLRGALTDTGRPSVAPAGGRPHHPQVPPAWAGAGASPTCYSDLVGGTGPAGKDPELLRLVHGVVSAGHHHGVPGLPRPHVGLQRQERAVDVGVDGDGELGPHCGPGRAGRQAGGREGEKGEGVRGGPWPSVPFVLAASSLPFPTQGNARAAWPNPTWPGSHLSRPGEGFGVSTKTPTIKGPFISSGQRNFPPRPRPVGPSPHTHLARDVTQIQFLPGIIYRGREQPPASPRSPSPLPPPQTSVLDAAFLEAAQRLCSPTGYSQPLVMST